MRLAQAARKLSITTEDIIDFLEIRGITIEKDSNIKLDDKAVELLYKYFEIEEEKETEIVETEKEVEAKTHKEDNQEAAVSENKIVKEEQIEEELEEKQEEVEALEKEDPLSEIPEEPVKKSFKTVDELLEEEGTEYDEDFVIKPAKVELKGLNVVGKIDLPEPKQKPEPEQKEEQELKPKKPYSKSRPQKSQRRSKREVSPAEIRKREEQKEARKRLQAEKEKKRKREQFYKEKILKPKQIEQKRKPKKKQTEAVENETVQKPQPKTVLGKFWRWLNT